MLEQVKPSVLVIEACALCGWVYDLSVERGVACQVANTASEAWKFKHTKRKSDKDDALRLAQLFAFGQLPTVTIPSKVDRQWKIAIAARQALVGRRIAEQNRIRGLLVGQGLPMPRGVKAWSELGLKRIEQLARPLRQTDRTTRSGRGQESAPDPPAARAAALNERPLRLAVALGEVQSRGGDRQHPRPPRLGPSSPNDTLTRPLTRKEP